MLNSLFSKKQKETLSVVYDIGSASVGGALVLNKEGESPQIIYSSRREFPFQEKLNISRLKSSMLDAVDRVSQDIEKNGLRHLTFTRLSTRNPKKSFVSFASPWFGSQTRIISIKKEKPFIITKKMIDKITEKEIDSFKNSKEVEDRIGEKEPFVMEKRIISIKLNGYQTNTPYGKKANSVELAVLISVAPKQILEDILKNIQKTFNMDDIETASFPFIAFDAIRNVKEKEDSFLFVDIRGELTDVSLVRSGVLLDTSSFPIGKKTIIRQLSKEMKTTKDDALSTLKIYMDVGFSSSKNKQKKEKISIVENKWITIFTKTLEDISENFSIPYKIYITSDEDLQNWFIGLIAKEEFGQYIMSSQNFEIHKVNSKFFRGLYKGRGRIPQDPFLLIGAIFLNKSLVV